MGTEQLRIKIQILEQIKSGIQFIDALSKTILADTTTHTRNADGSSTAECAMRHIVHTYIHLPTPLPITEVAKLAAPLFETRDSKLIPKWGNRRNN